MRIRIWVQTKSVRVDEMWGENFDSERTFLWRPGKIGEIMNQIASQNKTPAERQNIARLANLGKLGRLRVAVEEGGRTWMRILCWHGPTY